MRPFLSSYQGCGIILRVVKSRQPLLQAGKLLYQLSKDTANDSLFRRERLLEPLLKTVRGRLGESMVDSRVRERERKRERESVCVCV